MIRNPASKLVWGERTTGLMVVLSVIGALLMAVVLALPAQAVPSTFTVNRTGDQPDADTADNTCDRDLSTAGNQCTLRAAIQEANVNNNPIDRDRINFNIPGTGLNRTITPNSALPTIDEPVIIDGYSQPGSSVNTQARGTNAILRIMIDGTNFTTEDNGLSIEASNTVVKGLVINRFGGGAGIFTEPSVGADLVTNVRIEGNFLGTNRAGTSALGNETGVSLFATSDSTVGGTSLASRNLISGNNVDGVFIQDGGCCQKGSSDNNRVQGNLIGTQRDGISALGNSNDGVRLFEVLTNNAVGNRILSNSIFANAGEGIDLGAVGPTPNDAGDTDTGPNRLQNFPVLSSAKTISQTTTIEGTLNSLPDKRYTIQFFSSPSVGVGQSDQGQRFIGSKSVLTNASGDATFSFSPSTAVTVGRQITATATRQATGDTSEFSAAREVTAS